MKTYELRVFKRDREITRGAEAIRVPLDLSNAETTRDLLERHLIAAAERDGAHRREAHLYHFEAHEVYSGEHVERRTAFKFSLPITPEDR
ncbi:hypothetical protein K1W54_04435 [Micromonospora sp. CPCC 205371]|nr:hypothetical protein [Micromonospora sp. CPCC 205371]